MNQRNSTIELSTLFNLKSGREELQGKTSRKPDIDDFFLIRGMLMVKKYMHENLGHTVRKHLAKKLKSIRTFRRLLPTTANTFSDFISNNTGTFIELLPNTAHFS